MRNRYVVTSPVYDYTEYIPGMGGGPGGQIADSVLVFARNRRRARVAAVRYWARHCPGGFDCCWTHIARRDDMSPFSGLRVEPAR